MKRDWMSDARQIPDKVMTYLRQIAVCAVIEKNCHPDDVSNVLGVSRSSVYDWLRRFTIDGYDGLETQKAPGMPPLVTKEMDQWLKDTVVQKTPEDFGYETPLWTCDILAELLRAEFGIQVVAATVNDHLKKLNLSYQKPCYRAIERNPEEVKKFLEYKFPRIQRLAARLEADIAFEDEAGIDLRERSGGTWGVVGETPKVSVTGKRGHCNVLSSVTAEGNLRYRVTEETITAKTYITFLESLIADRVKPLFLIADRASFHTSKMVRRFVCSHRKQLRLYYLPSYSPDLNPDEHVWEEIKDKRLGRSTILNKPDLLKKLRSALRSLQENKDRIKSFFLLPETKYAAGV